MLDGRELSPTRTNSTSEHIADFALGLRYDEIPTSVVEAAKLHVLDTIGCGIAAHALGIGTAGKAAVPALAEAAATVIGRPESAAASDAAFANGMLCHALDFDDTHGKSICHIGVVVVPALFAAAESRHRSGRELIAAIVAGSEVVARVGAVAAPEYMVRGFHPTSVCGVFGAAIGAARLLDLEREAIVSALGIAGSMAGGLFAYLGDGSSTKPIHAGFAASNGIRAAELAALGAEGPRTVFEDRFGFFAAYYEGRHEGFAKRVSDLGSTWESERTSFKAYPACHFIHGCLDAASAIRQESGWAPSQIRAITVAIPDPGVPLVIEPIETKRSPRTDYEGKFSLPYSVASMLVRGQVDLASYFTDALRDDEVSSLSARVDYERRTFETYPESFPGWVRVVHTSGDAIEREVLRQRGAPENPMDAADVVAKFRLNAALALPADAATALEASILSLDDVDDVESITKPLAGAVRTEVSA